MGASPQILIMFHKMLTTNTKIPPAQIDTTLEIHNTPIQGKSIKVSLTLNEFERFNFDSEDSYKDHVKRTIAIQLADAIINNNLGEFTRFVDKNTGQATVRGRCFILPNDEVQILRTQGVIK